ncbi:MAG TPA: protein kinase [Candidatus Eisenbacteria bacterium]|nr:protein kinase [Candidatus Eisenbacteria bacterium]
MTVTAGARLGPYEIRGPLGAGGMGEVHRARDPRLGRDVAVKVLPPAFASDPERLSRFEQEARAVAALNHPNILAIYDVGAEGGRPFLVTELLEGETLRGRLDAEPLPLRHAIELAVQVARGLAAAHEKGIVHRDLKPANLFVSKDRRLKILDFGLAKLVGPAGSPESTIAAAQTQSGVVLGTVGYMSPEQVRGEPADSRSDLFALGTILYEMLTGKRAFQAATAAETMTAILRSDPEPMRAPGRDIPPALEKIVLRCLEKDPRQRYHSAHDLAFHLESALEGMGVAGAGPGAGGRGAFSARWLVPAMLLTGITGGLLFGVPLGERSGSEPPEFQRVTYRPGFVWSGRFAPDGRTIVYGAAWAGGPPEIFSTRPESPESRALGLSDASILSVSRSGELAVLLRAQYAGGWAYKGTLARLPIEGGAPREILEGVLWADWEPKGEDLAVVREEEGSRRLEFPIGKVLHETGGTIREPRFSPKGDRIAFLDHPIFGDDRGYVAIADRSGNVKRLTDLWKSIQGVAWAPDGEEIWFTAAAQGPTRGLYAVTRGGKTRTIMRPPGSLALQDISREGEVLLAEWTIRYGIAGRAPGDREERDLSWLDWSAVRDFSRDGSLLLFTEGGEGGGPAYGVYLRKTDGSPAVRLGDGEALALSPDGKWVLSIERGERPHPVLLPTGAGQAGSLPSGPIRDYQNGTFLPDGSSVLLLASEPGHGLRYYLQRVDGGEPRAVTPEGIAGFGFGSHLVSPDGKSVVARGPDKTIGIWPLAGGDPKPVRGLLPAEFPIRWSLDGRHLVTALPEEGRRKLQLARVDVATGTRTVWKDLVPADAMGVTRIGNPMVSPDGSVYAYTYGSHVSDLYLVEGLK